MTFEMVRMVSSRLVLQLCLLVCVQPTCTSASITMEDVDIQNIDDTHAESSRSEPPSYPFLDPANFKTVLGSDFDWATDNIPLFESANATLDNVYYFRWRSYKSHIHATQNPDVPFVVTEFSPNVGWAGEYNTINCAAGHHMVEAGWMRNSIVVDSYTRWWVNQNARHNYYYWYASALKRYFDRSANVSLLQEVVPAYKEQFLKYANGTLPGNAAFSPENDCLWNAPGNEGQEQTISGPGCRPLVQSLMFGEANALSHLCGAIGDTQCVDEMNVEASKWQARVLRLWNTNISSFDTLRIARPSPPPAPPQPPAPKGWSVLPTHNGTFCCDQAPCVDGHSKFLYEGQQSFAECFSMCAKNNRCNFVTYSSNSDGYCFNAQFCNTTNPYAGNQKANEEHVHTYSKPSVVQRRTLKISDPAEFANVRELPSLSSPWFFSAIPVGNASLYASSWLTVFDPDGLGGPNGLRTAEKRHPRYFCGLHCCSWSGPVWPFETAKALTAVINVINNYPEVEIINGSTFWNMLWPYTASHTTHWRVVATTNPPSFYPNLTNSNVAQWLFDGLGDYWVAETGCGDDTTTVPYNPPLQPPFWSDVASEGYRYNHATFMDIILSGVVGLQPLANGTLIVNPLVPATTLPWWAADGILLHGRIVTTIFDVDGSHYHKGTGLQVLLDGKVIATSPTITKLYINL